MELNENEDGSVVRITVCHSVGIGPFGRTLCLREEFVHVIGPNPSSWANPPVRSHSSVSIEPIDPTLHYSRLGGIPSMGVSVSVNSGTRQAESQELDKLLMCLLGAPPHRTPSHPSDAGRRGTWLNGITRWMERLIHKFG